MPVGTPNVVQCTVDALDCYVRDSGSSGEVVNNPLYLSACGPVGDQAVD